MSIVIIEDTSDTGQVRNMLTQAGRMTTQVRPDDLFWVFQGAGAPTVYTDYADIVDVQGIWLADDITHSGTNYVSGSTVYPKQGKIEVGQSLPQGTEEVLVTYAARDGLSDGEIDININMAKQWMTTELWVASLDFSGSSTFSVMAKYTLYALSSYWCILALNNANAIQAGFNYRFEDFEIQTKLWGEGMIAETLLANYWQRAKNMIDAMKLYVKYPSVPIYVIDRGNSMTPYNGDPTIFDTKATVSATTIWDSTHQYSIVVSLKHWGN